MEHILNLEQVKKYYGGNSGNITKAVDGISMYVDKGEFVAIMGASGSGKTTLLNCISTIDTVTSGHITVNNQDITNEYYGAAEPPVRCGESHLSGLTEPPHFVY